MKELYELKEALVDELAQYSRGRIDKKNLCEIDMLAHATKNVCKVIESLEEEEYSSRGNSYRTPHMRLSYKRDSMGRYSNNNSYHTPREMADQLMELMEEAPDEASRQDFQRLINKLNTM